MRGWIDVSLTADTCFAAGRGRGVDTDVEHDARTGLPVLRGRTLKGLLVEELALILKALHAPAWAEAAAALFGTPEQEGRLRIGNGALDSELVDEVKAQVDAGRWKPAAVLDALTRVRHQTRVKRDTGAPADRSLRSTRVLRAGLSFRHPIEAASSLSPVEEALLAATVAAVRRVGLHRSRGWGRVELRVLDEEGQDRTASWLASLLADSVAPGQGALPTAAAPWTAESSRSDPRVLTYRLTLEAPAVLGGPGGDPNMVETVPFIRGAAVLGAAAARWLTSAGSSDPAADPQFRRLFLTGEVRWLHAYPEGRRGRRLVPAPRSLAVHKDEAAEPRTVRDRAAEAAEDDEPEDLRGVGGWFVAFDRSDEEPTITWREPARTERMHHLRDREAGRPEVGSGSIFTVVALDAGQRFIGHVLCQDGADAERVKALIESGGPLRLGRSRTATYGGAAQIEVLAIEEGAHWSESPVCPEADEGRVVVTLLSEYLGRDASGQASPEALAADLGEALGLAGVRPARAFFGAQSIAGYVGAWRMPRPRHAAIAAGSVIVFDARPEPARIRELEWSGLGERRAEGFGRIAVDTHGHGDPALGAHRLDAGPAPQRAARRRSPTSEPLARLRREMARGAVRAHLLARAEHDAHGTAPPPPPALIARIRTRVRTAASAIEVHRFLVDAQGDAGTKSAGRHLARARRGAMTLGEWLLAVVDAGGGGRAWRSMLGAEDAAAKANIAIDDLGAEDDWPMLQTYLDAYCEALRRSAQRTAKRSTP